MSKEAALRAMREAAYAARTARSAGASATQKAAPAAKRPPAAKPTRAAKAAKAAEPSPAADGLCGHRSMNGRSCTREQGHAAKSHRYG